MSVWKYVTAGCVVALSLMAMRKLSKVYQVYKRGMALCGGELKGKTAIITGANCGIGRATALELAKRQARVILACRSEEKGKAAISDIKRFTKNGDLVYKHLDRSSYFFACTCI